MPEQRFDEQQIGAILQRAAEIQSDLAPETPTSGVTLDELRRVASEIGIEPGVLDQAAHEIQTTPRTATFTETQTFDHTVEGELSEEKWDDLVLQLRESIGKAGKTNIEGNTREWAGGTEFGAFTFTATSRNGKTRFRLMLDTSGITGVAFVAGFASSMMLVAISVAISKKAQFGALYGTLFALTVLATVVSTAYFGARASRKKARQQAAALFKSLLKK